MRLEPKNECIIQSAPESAVKWSGWNNYDSYALFHICFLHPLETMRYDAVHVEYCLSAVSVLVDAIGPQRWLVHGSIVSNVKIWLVTMECKREEDRTGGGWERKQKWHFDKNVEFGRRSFFFLVHHWHCTSRVCVCVCGIILFPSLHLSGFSTIFRIW